MACLHVAPCQRHTPSGSSWGEKSSETGNCQSSEPAPKNAPSPAVRLLSHRRTLPACTSRTPQSGSPVRALLARFIEDNEISDYHRSNLPNFFQIQQNSIPV